MPGLLAAICAVESNADNIEIVPPANGSFVIKRSSGDVISLEVTDDGAVIIDGRELDLEPPVITTDAPAFSDTNTIQFNTTYTDNQALASFTSSAIFPPSASQFLDAGTTQHIQPYAYQLKFGQQNTLAFNATDSSGNVGTLRHTVTTPTTALVPGRYAFSPPITSGTFATCENFADKSLAIDEAWIFVDWGPNPNTMYMVITELALSPGDVEAAVWEHGVPIAGSSFQVSAESHPYPITATVEVVGTEPDQIDLTLVIDCTGNGGQVYGPYSSTGTWVSAEL